MPENRNDDEQNDNRRGAPVPPNLAPDDDTPARTGRLPDDRNDPELQRAPLDADGNPTPKHGEEQRAADRKREPVQVPQRGR